MLFLSWSSGMGCSGFFPPFLFLLPLLLQGGISIFSFLPSSGTRSTGGSRLGQPGASGARQHQENYEGAEAWLLVLTLAVGAFTFLFMQQGRQQGWGSALRSLWLEGFHFGGGSSGQHARARQARGRRRQRGPYIQPRNYQHRFADVAAQIQKMPVEQFLSAQALRKLPAHQLKEEMCKAGLQVRKGESLDREDAVARLLALRDSSSCACSVCCEDYGEEDHLRVLPCKHRFHVECIDRWFLSAADRSAAPCCPMCNSSLA